MCGGGGGGRLVGYGAETWASPRGPQSATQILRVACACNGAPRSGCWPVGFRTSVMNVDERRAHAISSWVRRILRACKQQLICTWFEHKAKRQG